jgi:hypothetical protein
LGLGRCRVFVVLLRDTLQLDGDHEGRTRTGTYSKASSSILGSCFLVSFLLRW